MGTNLMPFRSNYLGFNDLFSNLDRFINSGFATPKYPFYDITATDDGAKIEVAAAGFTKEQLEVSFNKDTRQLTISGTSKQDKKDKMFSSMAARSFTKTFVLDHSYEVDNVVHENGVVTVNLKKEKAKEDSVIKYLIN